ncbi:MAG TPA: branched-chain amino acid ABC transporter permease [Haliangiales bacterium]|nr:branched-chain amino acid ABC transporter permease [Haliangiales bacterium]
MSRGAAKIVGLAALGVVACAVPFVASSFHVFQLTQIVVYAIALLGLNLLTGFNGQISLGHGAFYAIGAYTTAILLDKVGFPYWATVPIAGALCFGVGFLFGLPALRLEGPYLALATFALAVTTPQLLKVNALERWTGGVQGLLVEKPGSPIGGVLDADQWLYFLSLGVAFGLYLVAWNLLRGRTGRALMAIRDHPIAAATMGIDTALYKSLTFGVSACYTGVAGALGALLAGFVSPDSFTILLSIHFIVGVVVGGIASIGGMLFGAAFVTLVPNLADRISQAAPWAIYGAVLIAFMILMPTGAAGFARAVARRLFRGGNQPI